MVGNVMGVYPRFLGVFLLGFAMMLASCSVPEVSVPVRTAKDASTNPIPQADTGVGGPTVDAGDMRCEAPRIQCGSRCVNVLTDSANCGECNQPCTGGAYCNDGQCTRTCPAGTVACGSSCVDLATDTDHCGVCDNACAADRECRGGQCNCQQGNIECAGACINPNTDVNNCGICGRSCGADEICNVGSCACAGGVREASCDDGQDNDCDSLVDCEDSDCVDATRGCMGSCGPGVETCEAAGQWGMCVGGSGEAEICGDGIDQDCNGSDLRMPDSFEPNDSCGQCKYFNASPDPVNVSIMARMDSVNDGVDCFRFDVEDNTSIFGPESISIQLENIPMGTDYDVYLYQSRDDCLLHGTAQAQPLGYSANLGNMDESLSWTEQFGVSDSGIYYILVLRFQGHSCTEDYTLTVDGLN
jgi:hypothetical protein